MGAITSMESLTRLELLSLMASALRGEGKREGGMEGGGSGE